MIPDDIMVISHFVGWESDCENIVEDFRRLELNKQLHVLMSNGCYADVEIEGMK